MAERRDLRTLLGTASLVGLAALSGPALAQSTDTLTVLASVGGECTVTGATLDFGSYSGTQKDVEVPISFECNAPTNIAISMDGGATGDPNGRQMFNGDFSSQILYELYRDANRSQIWGVFPQDSADFASATTGAPTVFGRLPAGQSPLPGSYSDAVVITLTTN
ncbi:MAG: Csu type fimbrial protein [Geminicoccaceae bacterium]